MGHGGASPGPTGPLRTRSQKGSTTLRCATRLGGRDPRRPRPSPRACARCWTAAWRKFAIEYPCHSATEDAKAIYQTVSGGKFREVRGRRPARDRGPHLGLTVCNPYCVDRASFGPRSLIVRNVSRVWPVGFPAGNRIDG